MPPNCLTIQFTAETTEQIFVRMHTGLRNKQIKFVNLQTATKGSH